jgi:hypothetical protein
MEDMKGMDARSIEYVLGVEDCATMVYDLLEGGNQELIKKNIELLLNHINDIRSSRFLEDNDLLN